VIAIVETINATATVFTHDVRQFFMPSSICRIPSTRSNLLHTFRPPPQKVNTARLSCVSLVSILGKWLSLKGITVMPVKA
jgi:hypothetical protein